jgi:hypothetical protein
MKSLLLALSSPLSFLKNKSPLLHIKGRWLKLGLHHSDDFGLQGFSFPSNNQFPPLFFFFFLRRIKRFNRTKAGSGLQREIATGY